MQIATAPVAETISFLAAIANGRRAAARAGVAELLIRGSLCE